MGDDEQHVDQSQWLPPGDPILTPERYAKADLKFSRECSECNGRGTHQSAGTRGTVRCSACNGKGRIHQADDTPIEDVRYAQANVRNIMNFLWEINELDEQNTHDGQTYEIWQTCFSAFLGYRNSPVYRGELAELRNAIAADNLDLGDFEKLIRALHINDKRLIEQAIYTTANEHNRWHARRNVKPYRTAFDRLTTQMERLREAADDRRKAAERGPGYHDAAN